jgi:hypothetical protein
LNARCRRGTVLDLPLAQFVAARAGRYYRNAVKRHDLIENQEPRAFGSVPPSVKLPNSGREPIGEPDEFHQGARLLLDSH